MLTGKRCIVAGGANGIGHATAKLCAQQGAEVLVVDIDEARLATVAAEFGAGGLEIMTAVADLSVKSAVDAAVSSMLDRFGGIDALICSQAITLPSDTIAGEVPEETFDRTLAVNLKSVFLLCSAVVPHMRASGGAIVNIASIGAVSGIGGISYTASKGGLVAMSRQIAFQEAANNIRCNSVLPGFVNTEMVRISQAKAALRPFPKSAGRLDRMAEPEEVASLVAFLVSDPASFITGSSYVIDGGFTQH